MKAQLKVKRVKRKHKSEDSGAAKLPLKIIRKKEKCETAKLPVKKLKKPKTPQSPPTHIICPSLKTKPGIGVSPKFTVTMRPVKTDSPQSTSQTDPETRLNGFVSLVSEIAAEGVLARFGKAVEGR